MSIAIRVGTKKRVPKQSMALASTNIKLLRKYIHIQLFFKSIK